MTPVPWIGLTILALAAIFMIAGIGIPILVAAIIVIAIRKQRGKEVAAAGPASTSPAAIESAD